MKKRVAILIALIVAFVLMAASFAGACVLYREPPAIESTKLQALQFDKIQDDMILCTYNGVNYTLEVDPVLEDTFEREAFVNEVKRGDGFLARISSDALSDPTKPLTPLAIKGYNNADYLLFDNTEDIYSDKQSSALLLILIGIVFLLVFACLSVLYFRKAPVKRK